MTWHIVSKIYKSGIFMSWDSGKVVSCLLACCVQLWHVNLSLSSLVMRWLSYFEM